MPRSIFTQSSLRDFQNRQIYHTQHCFFFYFLNHKYIPPGSIDVVTGDHSHGDTGPLALFDGVGDLRPHRILDTDDAQAGEIRNDILLVFPVGLVVNVYLVDVGLARHEVPISDRDRPEAVARHRLDHVLHQPILHVPGELFQITVATVNKGTSAGRKKVKGLHSYACKEKERDRFARKRKVLIYALLHDDFGSALGEEPEATALPWDDGRHALANAVERVDTRERLLGVIIAHRLIILAQGEHESK